MSAVGRSFMITGANSGIGKETSMAIAKKGTPMTGALCGVDSRVDTGVLSL